MTKIVAKSKKRVNLTLWSALVTVCLILLSMIVTERIKQLLNSRVGLIFMIMNYRYLKVKKPALLLESNTIYMLSDV